MRSERGWRCLFALPIVLGLFSSAAITDELAVRADLKSEGAQLLEQGDLTRYAQRATELRRTRERTPGGIWKLSLFIARSDPEPFAALSQLGVKWPVLRDSLEQIATAYPDPWNWNAERAMACLMGTQQDFNGALRRVEASLITVAWFDSAATWPQCEQRQKLAQQSSFDSWTQTLVSTPPSASFVAAATAGALLALALVYATRRRWNDASGLQDVIADSAASGSGFPKLYRVSPAWKTR